MKKLGYTFLAIGTILIFSNCIYNVDSESKERIKETRDVSNFSGINMCISGNVYLIQGSPQEVIIEGEQDDVDNIITKVENGKLIVKVDEWKINFKSNINVYVTIPEVDYLSISGSGDIIAEKNINTKEIKLKVSGSGKLNLKDLAAEKIETSISGSGKVLIGGNITVQEHELHISGSGKLEAENLAVNKYDVSISGSGNATVKAEEKIEARISGSGKVCYKGNAKIDATTSGSGKVVALD